MDLHVWDFVDSAWLPHYQFPKVTRIVDIWEEWSSGLDGHLSIRQLDEDFGARWRRNKGTLKTEYGRRKKIVSLVQWLVANRPRWDTALALCFLDARYQTQYSTARRFSNYLTENTGAGMEAVKTASLSFP